jgi:uncharacterized protein Yka (UPF0111/DUF47 family)
MLDIVDLIIRIIRELRGAMNELPEFKTSVSLHEKLVEINNLEEEGDRLYIEAVRGLYTDESLPPVQIAAWSHIFVYMEEVIDEVEDVANLIESVAMKNA